MGRGVRTGVGIGLGSLAVPVGIGWFYARVLLDTTIRPMFPERVLAATPTRSRWRRAGSRCQPGTWGLRWPAGHCAGRAGASTRTARGVVRPLLAGSAAAGRARRHAGRRRVRPRPGRARAGVHRGRRGHAAGRRARPGSCPRRWQQGDTWAVLVHGRGGPRREALRLLPALHALGLPALVSDLPQRPRGARQPRRPLPPRRHRVARRRGRGGATRSRRARGRSCSSAGRWARPSSGRCCRARPLAARVAALVWDAPLVDWRATLRQQARIRHAAARADRAHHPVRRSADRHRLRPVRPASPTRLPSARPPS